VGILSKKEFTPTLAEAGTASPGIVECAGAAAQDQRSS